MLFNLDESIQNIVNNTEYPILFLVVAEGCEHEIKSAQATLLEQEINKHAQPVSFYTLCIPEKDMTFPRVQTPVLYYFMPKNTSPAFFRIHGYVTSLNDDLNIIVKMMSGMTYEEARFSDEEREKIKLLDNLLEEEKETVQKMPPLFQQARGLAKEMWRSGKRAAQGLPVLVDADTGFQRLSTCQSCEFFNQESTRCSQCGCFMKTKTQIASASAG